MGKKLPMGIKIIAKRSLRASVAPLLLWLMVIPSAMGELPPIIGVIRCDTSYTLFGHQISPLGDQNGDGRGDFAIWDYRFAAYFYHGGYPLDTQWAFRLDSVNDVWDIGDVSGDGIHDFVSLGRSQYHWKFGLYYGGAVLDTARKRCFGSDDNGALFPVARGYDLNLNGSDELIADAGQQRSVLLFELADPFDSMPAMTFRPYWFPGPGCTYGRGIATGDFNGDGVRDLVVCLTPDNVLSKGQISIYWGGARFDTIPDLRFADPGPWQDGSAYFGRVLANVGDVNDDGYEDLLVGRDNANDNLMCVYFGGPTFDSIPDLVMHDGTDYARAVGDINGDGIADFMTSLALQSSSYSYVNIYYGGSDIDTVVDLRVGVWDMPEYLLLFGQDMAGLGDVNGDSIGDFAISAGGDQYGHGVVYVFAGKRSGTDVEEIDSPSLPASFTLSQNYPNPFNGATVIPFDLPRHSHAELSVYNLEGKLVTNLIDRELSAGMYRVTWNGRNNSGVPVASGVYFYRLSANTSVLSRKMLLLK